MQPAECAAPGGWRADVGIGSYEKTASGFVGADFISAQTAPPVCRRLAENHSRLYEELGNSSVEAASRFRRSVHLRL